MARIQDLKVNKITKARFDELRANGTITQDMINSQLWIFTDDQFVSSSDKIKWNNKMDKTSVPTKLSELTNDTGFITNSSIPTKLSELSNDSGFITKSAVPTKVSQLTNDSNYATRSEIPTKLSSFTNDASYAKLSDIPTDLSQLKDDVGFLKSYTETDPTVPAWAKEPTKPKYSPDELGLGQVENKSSQEIRAEITSKNVTDALGYIPVNPTAVGTTIATLDNQGKVPSSQLPSFVDDVLEFNNREAFPSSGESGKIYVAKDTNKTYRWSGTTFVPISTDLALGETSSTAYPGDKGKAAYTHSLTPHAPSDADENTIEQINVNGTKVEPSNKVVNLTVPTKMSELTNDVGFATGGAVPTKLSELQNDTGFITSGDIPSNVSTFNNDAGYITSSALPTKVGDLQNDTGFITSSSLPTKVSQLQNDSNYAKVSELPTKLSQMTNDANYVKDAGYVHTDNNLTAALLSNLNANTSARHSHTNKSVLDGISQDDIDNWNDKRAVGDTLPIGAIIEYPSDNVPEKWLLCNGQAVSRTVYSELFEAIGTTWGAGDGSTTFNLPTKEGLVTFGKKTSDTNFSSLGKSGGTNSHNHTIPNHSHTIADHYHSTASHTLTINEIPGHNHSGTTSTTGGHSHVYYLGWANWLALGSEQGILDGNSDFGRDTSWGGDHAHTFTTSSTGSGWGHSHGNTGATSLTTADTVLSVSSTSNLPSYTTSNFIIKAYNTVPVYAEVEQDLTSDSKDNTISIQGLKKLLDELRLETLKAENPVGHIRMETTNVNPADYLGFGTWVLWGSGQVPVGVNTSDDSFKTVEQTGGSKSVTLATANLPSHTHSVPAHSHSIPSHTHTGPSHTHSGPSHTHSFSATTGGGGAHYHSNWVSPSGSGSNYQYTGTSGWSVDTGQIDWGGVTGRTSDVGNHTHSVSGTTGSSGTGATGASGTGATGAWSGSTNDRAAFNTSSTGSGTAINVTQPYITCYMWKRTA